MIPRRFASATLLVRGEGSSLEVYLVERSPKLSFFGGYWALPGGVIDPVDGADGKAEPEPGEGAYRRAAVRELFEETGVLPTALAATAKVRRDGLRRALCAGESAQAWGELVGGAEFPEVRRLCRLTTPPFAPVLYRTRFFLQELPEGEAPEIWEGELVDGRFWKPAEAVAGWIAGELRIAPPVLFLLEHLAGRDREAFCAAVGRETAELEAGKLHPVRHSPGVLTAPLSTPTLPPATTTNCYLVGEEQAYVVDPATYEESERTRLFAAMDAAVARGTRFEGVLVTHHHHDHVGSVETVSERYSLPVLGHPLTLERLPFEPRDARALDEGSVLPLGRAPDGSPAWHLTCYHTPGHDRGHLVFVESRYGAGLVGDLVSTLSTIVIDPPEGHMRTYLETLERMAQVGMRLVYPAHGPAHPHPEKLLRKTLAHRLEREAKLAGALGGEARGLRELVAAVYDDVPTELWPHAERSLLAGLEKLCEEERAERRGEGWVAGPQA